MFCAHCGGPVKPGDRYCGACGQPVASPVPALRLEAAPREPRERKSLSRKSRILLASFLGAVLVAGVFYAVAHYTYGPASPKALQAKAEAALAAGNAAGLAHLLGPDQQALRDPKALEAFQKTLSKPEVQQKYKSLLAAAAGQAGKNRTALESLFAEEELLSFVPEKSWRGTRWRLKVEPAELTISQAEGVKVEGGLADGGPAAANGTISGLWPSLYDCQATVSNEFAKEEVTDSVDLLNEPKGVVRPVDYLITSLSISLPEGKGYTVTLNGKEISSLNGQVNLSPAPEKASVLVKAAVLGAELTKTVELDTKEQHSVDLHGALNDKMAELALETAYAAALSWTEARNSGDPSLLKAADPSSQYYSNAKKEIVQPAANPVQLVKVLVDPASIEWDGDTVRVNVREMYHLERQPDGWFSTQDPTSDHTYTLKKAGDGNGWWLDTDNGSVWFDDSEAIAKENEAAST